MAGDGGWVGGLVELEVLGIVGGLLLLRVVLGHCGPVLDGLGGRVGLMLFLILEACWVVVVSCEAGLLDALIYLAEAWKWVLQMPVGLKNLGAICWLFNRHRIHRSLSNISVEM